MKEVIGVGEIARMLGVVPETARQWCVSKKIPAFRFDENGRWKAYREDIADWIDGHRNATSGETPSSSEQSS
jgi:predicted site-specific integrase-resolvase